MNGSFFRQTFDEGFANQSYGQWFMFLILLVFMWTTALSLNAYVRRAV